MRTRSLVVPFLLLAACGGGDDDGAGATDAMPATADAPAAACDRDGFTAATELAERDADLDLLFYTGLTAGDPFDRLTVDFYFSLGATNGPHDLTLTGEDVADCATCVLVYRGCTGTTCEPATTYLADSGTLRVSALGGAGTTFAATLEDVRLVEVEIDRGTQHATPVPGGETWCLRSQTLGAPITTP